MKRLRTCFAAALVAMALFAVARPVHAQTINSVGVQWDGGTLSRAYVDASVIAHATAWEAGYYTWTISVNIYKFDFEWKTSPFSNLTIVEESIAGNSSYIDNVTYTDTVYYSGSGSDIPMDTGFTYAVPSTYANWGAWFTAVNGGASIYSFKFYAYVNVNVTVTCNTDNSSVTTGYLGFSDMTDSE